jgi:DHA2 family multidrug resistance protein
VILDAYPLEQRASAMSIWGTGIMLGPIMGPTLGGFLTDQYSWHWVFLINLPVGIVTVLGLLVFMDETRKQEDMRFDWFGFLALAVGIGALQLLLDRGEQVGWYDSGEIIIETIISAAGFYFFFAHSLTTDEPFVRFELFYDRNFAASCLFMAAIGVVLYGVMALITPFMQNLLGYPIMTAGYLLGARGVGTLFAMMLVGRLLRFIEARTLVGLGFLISAATLYAMIGFTTDTSAETIVVLGVIQGVGLGLVFVPLSTVAFTTLPSHLRTSGTAMLTLVRNIGSSVGISMVIATLTSTTTVMHARLAEDITPFNNALQQAGSMLSTATDQGRALLDLMLTQQATIISYDNTFKLLMVLTLAVLPLVLLIGSSRTQPGAETEVHAME